MRTCRVPLLGKLVSNMKLLRSVTCALKDALYLGITKLRILVAIQSLILYLGNKIIQSHALKVTNTLKE